MTVGTPCTIADLSHAASVPVTTLRYYERAGLLQPESRSHGNYRLYTNASLRRIKFIRAAQALGFTLDNVRELLGRDAEDPPPCRQVQTIIEGRLADIEQRLKDLRRVQRVLKSSLSKCKQFEQESCCHVVETLRSLS